MQTEPKTLISELIWLDRRRVHGSYEQTIVSAVCCIYIFYKTQLYACYYNDDNAIILHVTAMTKCIKRLIYFVELFTQAQFLPIITTPNLPEAALATNYAGLLFSTQIRKPEPMYSVCTWVAFQNGNRMSEELFYSSFFSPPCGNRTVNEQVQWFISCTDANGFISTNLKINSPLQSGMLNIEAQCYQYAGSETPEESVNIFIDIKGLFR